MIIDSFCNFDKYKNLNNSFAIISDFLNKNNIKDFENGECKISDDVKVVFLDASLKTLEENKLEIHKENIDVHFLIEGNEYYGLCDSFDNTVFNYDAKKDIQLSNNKIDNRIKITKGKFIVFFNYEPHMPLLDNSQEEKTVRKMIFKIRNI
ncbi:MAG: YhcH/YjgK/YiaL family protein [Pleomorphochaeta sp.]